MSTSQQKRSIMKCWCLGFIFLVAAARWPKVQPKMFDDNQEQILLLRITLDLVYEQRTSISKLEEQNKLMWDDIKEQRKAMSKLEEQLKILSASQEELGLKFLSGLDVMTESLLNTSTSEHQELLPDLQNYSTIHDLAMQDECMEGSHNCSEFAQCIDTIFSYNCRCLEGYTGDGFQCDDIDECQANTDTCPEEADCENADGGYNCTCRKPYEGDGHTCELNCGNLPGSVLVEDMGCLRLIRTKMTWEEANDHCLSNQMRLLEDIPSRDHFMHIWNAFPVTGWNFIGGKSRRWSTSRELINNDLYDQGQPNNPLDSCLALELDGTPGDVTDGIGEVSCSSSNYALCQFL